MLWIARYVLPHEPALRDWARRRVVSGLDADDVVQEIYLTFARLASVDHITVPRAYALQIANSIILRHIRRSKVAPMDPIDGLHPSHAALDEPSPEQHTHARQQLRRLADMVSHLPTRLQETFVLRKFEGLSQRDVAQRMGISEKTVERHMTLALHTLLIGWRNAEDGDVADRGPATKARRS
jgi:RNA polymerase sigma-70 factor (ECF subfamily)